MLDPDGDEGHRDHPRRPSSPGRERHGGLDEVTDGGGAVVAVNRFKKGLTAMAEQPRLLSNRLVGIHNGTHRRGHRTDIRSVRQPTGCSRGMSS